MAEKKLTLEVIAKTDAGMVREANEDNFIVTPDRNNAEWILPKGEYANSEGGTVMVVADGMGGLNAGEVASNIAVDSIRAYFSKAGAVKDDVTLSSLMREAILKANMNIVRHSQSFKETEGMGSTLVMAWVKGPKLYLAWVGDSRCYIWRKGRLLQLSKDHSYVQSLVDEGKLTSEQAFFHPESNVITQSLGDDERKPEPGDCVFPLNNEDIILLCSDGLNAMLQDGRIEEIITAGNSDLAPGNSLSSIADRLIEEAKTAGGLDNITVILAKIVSGASSQPDAGVTEGGLQRVKKKKVKRLQLVYGLLVLVVLGATFFGGSSLLKGMRQQGAPTGHAKPDTLKKTVHPADTGAKSSKPEQKQAPSKREGPPNTTPVPSKREGPKDTTNKARTGDDKTILKRLPPAGPAGGKDSTDSQHPDR